MSLLAFSSPHKQMIIFIFIYCVELSYQSFFFFFFNLTLIYFSSSFRLKQWKELFCWSKEFICDFDCREAQIAFFHLFHGVSWFNPFWLCPNTVTALPTGSLVTSCTVSSGKTKGPSFLPWCPLFLKESVKIKVPPILSCLWELRSFFKFYFKSDSRLVFRKVIKLALCHLSSIAGITLLRLIIILEPRQRSHISVFISFAHSILFAKLSLDWHRHTFPSQN